MAPTARPAPGVAGRPAAAAGRPGARKKRQRREMDFLEVMSLGVQVFLAWVITGNYRYFLLPVITCGISLRAINFRGPMGPNPLRRGFVESKKESPEGPRHPRKYFLVAGVLRNRQWRSPREDVVFSRGRGLQSIPCPGLPLNSQDPRPADTLKIGRWGPKLAHELARLEAASSNDDSAQARGLTRAPPRTLWRGVRARERSPLP